MSMIDLMKEKLEKQLAAYDQQLAAAEAKAKARKSKAEADVAGAELEQELLSNVNEIKEKMAQGKVYLQELADAGEEKAEDIKSRISRFFD